MKEFRTVLNITPSGAQIHLATGILTQGSCFADAIGSRLATYKFNALANPFGVIYNPHSIHKALRCAVLNEPALPHTFVQNGEVFLNFDFHSGFSSLDKDRLIATIEETIASAHSFLNDASWLIITYGTAWVYRRRDTQEIVANCHKLPAQTFVKSLLGVEEIETSFRAFYEGLKSFNPKVKVILTVSPVRHIKDTLELNSVSKSVLRLAAHRISDAHEEVEYFPAYELMMDDLRDYRFYKEDMLHPSEEAEDYIWEKFMERYFSAGVKAFVREWKSILSAVRHRPFHPDTAAHQRFLRDTLKKLEELTTVVNVQDEILLVKQQLKK